MPVFLIAVLLFLGFLLYHSGKVLCRWLKLVVSFRGKALFWILYSFAVGGILAIFVWSKFSNCPLPAPLLRFAHYALGVLIYWVLFADFFALLLFLGKKTRVISPRSSRTVSLVCFALCLLTVCALSFFGVRTAGQIETVSYTVSLAPEKAQAAKGMKIVLVSDLHLGHMIDEEHLEKVVDAVNLADADLVCLAGDIFDGDMTAVKHPDQIIRLFSSIRSRYGVYAVLGNHDAGETIEGMKSLLAQSGISLLEDEGVLIENRLYLAGRRDASPIGNRPGEREPLSTPKDPLLPVVVMDHQPSRLEEYTSHADLVLCGHTHLGQMFPLNFIVRAIYDAPYGVYRASPQAPTVITTSGAGTWGPFLRVGSQSEIAEITLQ